MRPLALPFTGGVLSALLLFTMLAPALVVPHSLGADVPIALCTDPMLEYMSHYHGASDETVVEVTVDDRGLVAGIDAPDGFVTPEMKSDLLQYRFTPATNFGKPTWGKVIITFERTDTGSHIVVKG
jgi:hypothetical protein